MNVRSVPYVGTVVDGILNSGRLKAGDSIMFGPDSNGKFENTAVRTIQRKRYDILFYLSRVARFSHRGAPRAPVNSAEAGQCVSLALKRVRRAAVRKRMVIVHKTEAPPRGESSISICPSIRLSHF